MTTEYGYAPGDPRTSGPSASSLVSQFLSVDGEGGGGINLIGDFSSSPGTLKITAPAGFALDLTRLIFRVEDIKGTPVEKYGGLDALTEGITIKVHDGAGGIVADLTPEPIRANGDWASYVYDVQQLAWGAGATIVSARWSFLACGAPLTIPSGYELRVVANDDLTGLDAHTFGVHGFSRATV